MKTLSELMLEEINNPDNYDLEEAKYIISSMGLDPEKTMDDGGIWLRKQITEAVKRYEQKSKKHGATFQILK